MPVGQAIRQVGDKTLFLDRNQSATLSNSLLNDAQVLGHISGLIDGDACYLAFPGIGPYSYQLVCTDKETGERRWDSKVWNNAYTGGTSGSWHHQTLLIRADENILVFGEGTLCFYIEGFDRATGKNVFRFANKYDFERPR
ncbi:MAG: hypothetical protein QM775_03265 [Pirellulales bacterium]